MDNRKQKRTTLIVIGAALAVVVAGIIYLSMTADPNSVTPLNDGFDRYRVSLATAKEAYDNGSALMVDVRSPGEFASSHIPNAVNIPLNDISGNEPGVDKGALIYTYCT